VDKFAPKVAATAKILWLIYLGMTVLQTLLLLLGGLDLFDSLTHTFGTLATGGFSPRNASVAAFDSAYVDIVITVFMVAAGINFALYYRLLTGRLHSLTRNTELKAYLAIFVVASLLIARDLNGSVAESFGESLRFGSFQAASILTTTGYATADFNAWPAIARTALFALMFIGGSTGSTGGGIKVMRIVTLFKQGWNELNYLMQPRGVFSIRLNGQPVRKNIVYAISGFVALYLFLIVVTTVIVATTGASLETSLTTALATLGNIGPGLDAIGPTQNYAFFPAHIKWILSIVMMLGRLELYTGLVLFSRRCWRR
jgi:trk system potassium uptake protein TrkH